MLLKRRRKSKPKRIEKFISIQGSSEGAKDQMIIESLLSATRITDSVPGTINAFTNYELQVAETYRKYNAQASFGNQQVRAIVDLRTAFIAGEGISITAEDEKTSDWIENFLKKNNLHGRYFLNAVKGSEMAGQSLFLLKMNNWLDDSLYVKALRVPYTGEQSYRPVYFDIYESDEVKVIEIKKNGQWVTADFIDFIYIRTGGDDHNNQTPVTKVGTVLTDVENYDRAIKDMRRNNHIFARITPTWETKDDNETTALQKKLSDLKWTIGKAFIGSAKFKYVTPEGGAHENLNIELVATVKTISSVTGVPVHWLGYVDLMSNRSTAETLYELIKNATINERSEWKNSLYFLILKAQEMYINAGGQDLPRLDYEFEIKLPLLDFSNFLERVKGLNVAFADRAISLFDYRNFIPGIDPLKTEKQIEVEDSKEEEKLIKIGNQLNQSGEEEEGEGNE